MKIDVVEMFTSEIKAVELNMLGDELTLVIPPDLEVELVSHIENRTYVRLVRKAD
jgi:hypothetical protein